MSPSLSSLHPWFPAALLGILLFAGFVSPSYAEDDYENVAGEQYYDESYSEESVSDEGYSEESYSEEGYSEDAELEDAGYIEPAQQEIVPDPALDPDQAEMVRNARTSCTQWAADSGLENEEKQDFIDDCVYSQTGY